MKKTALLIILVGVAVPVVFFSYQKRQRQHTAPLVGVGSSVKESIREIENPTDQDKGSVRGVTSPSSPPRCKSLTVVPDPSQLVLDDDLEFKVSCTSSDADPEDRIVQVDFKFIPQEGGEEFTVSAREITPDPWTNQFTAVIYYPQDFEGEPNFLRGSYKVFSRVCSDNPSEPCSEYQDAL